MNPLNLVRPFGVVLAGVSMQGRQEAVNQAKIGDKAFGRREGATHKHSHAARQPRSG